MVTHWPPLKTSTHLNNQWNTYLPNTYQNLVVREGKVVDVAGNVIVIGQQASKQT